MSQVRSALRSDRPQPPVDDDIAPLSNELLPRLHAIVGSPPDDLAPRASGPDTPDAPAAVRLLSGLSPQLATIARENPDNPVLEQATRLVRAHVALATELALRAPTRQ